MKFWLITGTLSIAVGVLLAATVPFVYDCDIQSGFVTDPNVQKRIGYITALKGWGAPALYSDLTVSVPFMPSHGLMTMLQAPGLPPITNVIGVIETFSWNGGISDPLNITFYVSQENATMLKALQQLNITTAKISSLAWWIGDYDLEAKEWFEESYPKSSPTISGVVAGKATPQFSVDLNPVRVTGGIDVSAYKVVISVAPAANQVYTLLFASASTKAVSKTWGIKTP